VLFLELEANQHNTDNIIDEVNLGLFSNHSDIGHNRARCVVAGEDLVSKVKGGDFSNIW